MTALSATGAVLIRAARSSDGMALGRLAGLDSALVAAHSPAAGATIADPFRPTAEVVRLLELRGAMMRAS